jgi:hypothetical protein
LTEIAAMNISSDSARESLGIIEDTTAHTRKAMASSHASGLLILWGAIWVLAFTSVHFYPQWTACIFSAFNAVGLVGTFLICRKWPTKPTANVPISERMGLRVFLLWLLVGVYASVWLSLLSPWKSIQLCAFLCTLAMFGYVVIGLWFASYFMLWLGLAVTAGTLVGFYFFTDYFYLWMAPMGGGALLGTGLYIRLRWK